MSTLAAASIETKTQLINRRLGLWLFIASEACLFLTLIIARYYLIGTFRPEEVNQPLGLTITIILLISSFFANQSEVSIAHGDQKGFLRNILLTIVMGMAFLLIVVLFEWPEAMRFATPATGYGTALFSLTGLHAFHVLTGMVILLIIYFQGRRNHYSDANHWDVEAGIIYWHFVDLAWVVIYPTLYLVGPK